VKNALFSGEKYGAIIHVHVWEEGTQCGSCYHYFAFLLFNI